VCDGREAGESTVDQLAAGTPACVGDEPDAAGVAFE
jgi:hypothetical protein